MSENNGEMETVDPEIDTVPDAGGIVTTRLAGGREQAEAQMWLAANIDKLIEAQTKIRMAILKLAQPGDWSLFKQDNNDKGKAEIGFAGAQRIASVVGVSFTNWSVKKESGHDNIGDWYRWEYECDAIFRGVTVRVYGRAGSRDKFFGRAYKQWLSLEDVNEGNIKIAGRRAAMKEGTKCHLGLHHMDPEFITAHGVSLNRAGGYEFKGDNKGGSTDTPPPPTAQAGVGKKPDSTPPASPSNGGVISEAQGKRLYAILQNGSHDKGERDERTNLLKNYLAKTHKIEHSSDVLKENYDAVCKYAEDIAQNFNAGVGA